MSYGGYIWSEATLFLDIYLPFSTKSIKLIFPNKWENETKVDGTILTSILVSSSTHQINFNKVGQNIDIDLPEILVG